MKIGTTVATNALLERRGDRTLLVTTAGFRDALRIAYQNRPRLFERHIVLPELLYERVIEADERMGAHGNTVRPLDEARLRHDLAAAFATGLRACAVVFLHGYRHTAHEAAAARLAREAGFTQVSVSHEASPLMKLVSRGDTTVVDDSRIRKNDLRVGSNVLARWSNGKHYPGRIARIVGRALYIHFDDGDMLVDVPDGQPVTTSMDTGVGLVRASYTADRLRDCSTISRSVASSASPSMWKVTLMPL